MQGTITSLAIATLLSGNERWIFAELVYRVTDKFPRHERFGLMSQMRKAAVSVPSNIAEGHRHRTAGYISRIVIAWGEHAELKTQALLSERLRYVGAADMKAFNALSKQVGELAHGLLRSLEGRREQL